MAATARTKIVSARRTHRVWPAGRFAPMTAELAARAASEGRIAIDTEFVSERRYRALLCLVQVAVPDPEAPDGVRTAIGEHALARGGLTGRFDRD